VQIVRAVSSFSLFALLWAACHAEDYGKLADELNSQSAPKVARQVYEDPNCPPEVRNQAKGILDSGEPSQAELMRFRSALKAMAVEDKVRSIKLDTRSAALAKQIKRNPAFSDKGIQSEANWINKAFERLKNLRLDADPNIQMPQAKAPGLEGLMVVVWVLLGAGVLFLLVWAIRHFSWKRNLERKAKAMLEEDEPERTVDEWLELAESLSASGKYREAVRCLYLACLLRFDEFGIARFDRSQTNWEHLNRIQASLKMPKDLRFEPATQRFDVIWYGNRKAKPEDVAQFRQWYEEVLSRLKENPA